MELAHKIAHYGNSLPGLEQYSVKKFATALESFVKTLAENSGIKAKEIISTLYAAHNDGKTTYGFDVEVSLAIPSPLSNSFFSFFSPQRAKERPKPVLFCPLFRISKGQLRLAR